MSVQKIYSILRRTVTLSVLPRTIAMATGAALISVGCLIPKDAYAAVITSTVQGDENPAIINGESLQNGDFLITVDKVQGNGVASFISMASPCSGKMYPSSPSFPSFPSFPSSPSPQDLFSSPYLGVPHTLGKCYK